MDTEVIAALALVALLGNRRTLAITAAGFTLFLAGGVLLLALLPRARAISSSRPRRRAGC